MAHIIISIYDTNKTNSQQLKPPELTAVNNSAVPPAAQEAGQQLSRGKLSKHNLWHWSALALPTADPGPVMDTGVWLQALLGQVRFHMAAILCPQAVCFEWTSRTGRLVQTALLFLTFYWWKRSCPQQQRSLTTVNCANTVLWQQKTTTGWSFVYIVFSSRYYWTEICKNYEPYIYCTFLSIISSHTSYKLIHATFLWL